MYATIIPELPPFKRIRVQNFNQEFLIKHLAAQIFQKIRGRLFAAQTESQAAGDREHRDDAHHQRLHHGRRDTQLNQSAKNREDHYGPGSYGP